MLHGVRGREGGKVTGVAMLPAGSASRYVLTRISAGAEARTVANKLQFRIISREPRAGGGVRGLAGSCTLSAPGRDQSSQPGFFVRAQGAMGAGCNAENGGTASVIKMVSD